MRYIITESQYNRIIESEEKQEVLHIPSLKFFNDDWFILEKFLDHKGNPPYSIGGDLDLRETPIKSLGNLQSVGESLYLSYTPIKSLGNLQSVGGDLNLYNTPIKSLGNLQSVGGSLYLDGALIESLGNLQYVGGYLYLIGTPLSKMYNEKQICKMVNVEGDIYLK